MNPFSTHRIPQNQRVVTPQIKHIPNFIVKPNGKSFINCPKCNGPLYNPCNCEPKNYMCKSCNWSYFNHEHTNTSQINSKDLIKSGALHTFTLPK